MTKDEMNDLVKSAFPNRTLGKYKLGYTAAERAAKQAAEKKPEQAPKQGHFTTDMEGSDRGYGRRRYMGDSDELSVGDVVEGEGAAISPKELFYRARAKRAAAAQDTTGGDTVAESSNNTVDSRIVEMGNVFSQLVEANLSELSKDTLKSYIKKASQRRYQHGVEIGNGLAKSDVTKIVKNVNSDDKRRAGINKAVNKLAEDDLQEVSRDKLSSYISGAKSDENKDRSQGIALAQLKKWGDKKYGFPEPKVKASVNENLQEGVEGPEKWIKTAGHAIDQATEHSPSSEEHHKWMCVHHKAMKIYHDKVGDSNAASAHDAMAERHGDRTDDEDFHNGESHHWSKFY